MTLKVMLACQRQADPRNLAHFHPRVEAPFHHLFSSVPWDWPLPSLPVDKAKAYGMKVTALPSTSSRQQILLKLN